MSTHLPPGTRVHHRPTSRHGTVLADIGGTGPGRDVGGAWVLPVRLDGEEHPRFVARADLERVDLGGSPPSVPGAPGPRVCDDDQPQGGAQAS
jgi:hypothetical protein